MSVTGAAAFKKKQGMLTVYEDHTPPSLIWKCIDSSAEQVVIQLDQVTNLKATAPTSDKLALNVVVDENKKHVFSFNSKEVMNSVKQSLQQILARQKQDRESASATPVPQAQAQAQSQQQQQQQHLPNDEFLLNLLDAKKLLKNHQLQQKLLKENKQLMNTFREAVMNNGLDPQEFWNTRIHLLRSYAIQNNQKRGSYNVLSTIKPVATSDNEVNVSVTREKIHSIFEQYPIVRKIYNDNVPKRFGESVFWSRFFSSKLFRRLRGEKNYNNAKVDAIFDKYLHVDPDHYDDDDDNDAETPHGDGNDPSSAAHTVSKFIDLNMNEEDVSQKLGNAPDYTMKFDNGQDMVSILHSMNRLSKKMVSKFGSVESENEEYDLELSDLEDKELPEYNELVLKQTQRFSSEAHNTISSDQLQAFLTSSSACQDTMDLQHLVVDNPQIVEATKDISNLIRTNARQSKQSWQSSLQDDKPATNIEEESVSLSQEVIEQLRLCHSTSIEFQRHFWLNLQDPQANEKLMSNLYKGLCKSVERIDAIIQSTENTTLAAQVMQPLRDSLKFAISHYQSTTTTDLKHK